MNVQVTTTHIGYNNGATVAPRGQATNRKRGCGEKSTHWRVICSNPKACPSNRIKLGTYNFLPLATLSRRPFWMASCNSRRRSSIVKTERNSRCRHERKKSFTLRERKAHAVGVPRRANDDGEPLCARPEVNIIPPVGASRCTPRHGQCHDCTGTGVHSFG